MRIWLAGGDNVPAKTGISAPVFPPFPYPVFSATEYSNKAIVDIDLVTDLAFQFINAYLGNICPDAEDIGEIGDIDDRFFR